MPIISCCHCDSLVWASEVVEPPDESQCLHAGLPLETDSCLPSCSGPEPWGQRKGGKEEMSTSHTGAKDEKMATV